MLYLCPDAKLWRVKAVALHSVLCHSHTTEIILREIHSTSGEGEVSCLKTALCKGNVTTYILCFAFRQIQRYHIKYALCNAAILCLDVCGHLLRCSFSFSGYLGHAVLLPCSSCNSFLECIPCVLCRIIHIRVRTYLSGHIIVTDNIRSRHSILLHQVLGQLNGCFDRCILKVPILAYSRLTSFISDTQLNADRVRISALCMFITACPTMPCNVIIRNALPYFSVKTYKVVGGCSYVFACIILTICLCSSKGSYIVDDDILNAPHVIHIREVELREKLLNLRCCHLPHSPLQKIPCCPGLNCSGTL